MNRFLRWTVVVVCLLSAAVAFGQNSNFAPTGTDRFLGLWEGVDPFDGSPVRLSLSDVNNDGVIEHTLQEDFFTFCFNLGPGHSRGRGVVNGTATVVNPFILNTLTELTCLSDNNARTPLGLSPLQYVLTSRGRALVLPPLGASPSMVLHRVAQ